MARAFSDDLRISVGTASMIECRRRSGSESAFAIRIKPKAANLPRFIQSPRPALRLLSSRAMQPLIFAIKTSRSTGFVK